MNLAVVISMLGLIVVVMVHIGIIARWSGRIEVYIEASNARLEAYIVAINARMEMSDREILRLREARHVADGILQRHEGLLVELDRRRDDRRRDES